MKAMGVRKPCLVEEGPLELMELPLPSPGPGQIRIRVAACGICHTDLHIVEGAIPLPKSPLVPGHQIVGTVEACGQGVTRFRDGDRVGVPWLHHTCGRCFFCARGDENLCDKALFTGYHMDGGYAEYVLAPQEFSYALPADFPDLQAAPLLCAGVIGYRALRLSDLKKGERLGLFGFGASAHIVIQIARSWNCDLWVFSRSPKHQELARQLGASWVGRAEETPPGKLDRAILFAPSGGLVPAALRHLRKGGTLAIASIYLDTIPELDYSSLLHGERTVRSVTASTRHDAEELLKVAAEIPIHTEIEVFPLEEANQSLQKLKHGHIQGAGVLQIRGRKEKSRLIGVSKKEATCEEATP